MIRAEVVTDAVCQLLSGQLAGRLGNCSFAMHPLRLDVVEPRAFGRQKAGDNLHALFAFSPATKHLSVVLPYPTEHFTTDVPLGVVPDEHQHPLAFRSQSLTDPLQVSCAHTAHRSSINEAQKHLVGVIAQQSIAAYRFGVRVVLLRFYLLQAQRLSLLGPGAHPRLGKPAPPDFVSVANHPTVRCSAKRTSNQGVASLFLRSYSGSGEVIQCLARCQPTPNRCKATRIRSMLTSRSVTPCSKQTSAASASVQTEVGLPKVRGLWCRIARNRCAFSWLKIGCTVFGRRDLGRKQSNPSAWKALITLRTICKEQPRLRAISEGRWPLEEASSIWERRMVKASGERSPSVRVRCSSSERVRTNNGAFMPHSTRITHHYTSSFVSMH